MTWSMTFSHPKAPAEEMVTTAEPEGMCLAARVVRCRAATKFTSMTSRPENGGPGRPAQLNSPWIGPPRASRFDSMASGSRRSTDR